MLNALQTLFHLILDTSNVYPGKEAAKESPASGIFQLLSPNGRIFSHVLERGEYVSLLTTLLKRWNCLILWKGHWNPFGSYIQRQSIMCFHPGKEPMAIRGVAMPSIISRTVFIMCPLCQAACLGTDWYIGADTLSLEMLLDLEHELSSKTLIEGQGKQLMLDGI